MNRKQQSISKYPAIQKQLQQLDSKYKKQESQYEKMMKNRLQLLEQKNQLDSIIQKIKNEINEQNNKRDEILEEQEVIQDLRNQIIQNQQKILQLITNISQEQSIRCQRNITHNKNTQMIKQFDKYAQRGLILSQIESIMKQKKQLWALLCK